MEGTIKREIFARLLQIMTMVFMSSNCYMFAGTIYKQNGGAGIGDRASACIAKVCMAMWDIMWTSTQQTDGLIISLFFRCIDDLRILILPINSGWTLGTKGWKYDKRLKDERSREERTKEEILKSLESMVECFNFTVETQDDYDNGCMPTLDT